MYVATNMYNIANQKTASEKMEETMIEMKNLAKSYGTKKVLYNVNFQVNSGEIFGLLGPSGSGKTTIINILTKQITHDNGTFNVEASAFEMGLMLEEDGLYKRLTCAENLNMFATIYNKPKSHVDKVLQAVGLSEQSKQPVMKLSKGQRQRLAIARAIINQPKVLFLDEPTANLDPVTAKEIHQLVIDLKNAGTTVFLTTHNMEEAVDLCTKVALLNKGMIVEYGTPIEVCDRHDSYKTVPDLGAVFVKLTKEAI